MNKEQCIYEMNKCLGIIKGAGLQLSKCPLSKAWFYSKQIGSAWRRFRKLSQEDCLIKG